jgi:flagellar biosynthesis/type III secretory pathway ATPase
MSNVTSAAHRTAADKVREALGAARDVEDLVRIGAYVAGSDATADWALAHLPAIHRFLRQPVDQPSPFDRTVGDLGAIWQAAPASPGTGPRRPTT